MRSSAQRRVGYGLAIAAATALCRLPAGPAARRAFLRRPHPADPQHLLRRQHLPLPQHRDRPGHQQADGARQPRSLVVRGGPEAARRAPDLRQLPAAAAAVEGDAAGEQSDPLPRKVLPERDPAQRRLAHPARHRGLLRAEELARQRRQPRRNRAPGGRRTRAVGPCNDALPPVSQRIAVDTTSQAYLDFKANVEPMLESSCAYGSCHSSVQADMYLTCGLSGSDPDARDGVQLRAGGGLRDRAARRHDDDQRRSERDPPAAAGHRGRRCEPHRRDLLPVAHGQHLALLGSRGPRRSRPRRRSSTGPRPPGRRSSRRT